MTDLDLRLRDELDVLFPQPRLAPRWEDVVARARPPLRRRPLVLAFAAAVVVLASAAAVTAALGGFDAWLSGSPGKPASSAEQARFEAANGRTWAAFPKSTELRELIRTEVAGKTYVLFGFRSGSTLCLKLKAVSLGHSTPPACTPVSTLAYSTAPIVIVNSDFAFYDRHAHTTAQVSFGIAADGVRRVDVRTSDGTDRAVVGGNAYVFVEDEPNTGNRVLAISAVGPDRRRASISLAAAGVARRPRGPTHVEARIAHPKIGWVIRGEKRGFGADRLSPAVRGSKSVTGVSARYVKPDPYSDLVVGLDGAYCLLLVQGNDTGGSCSSGAEFFERAPINVIESGGGGVTAWVVAGAAADGIARIVVFGADGQRVRAPLRDNLFALRLSADALPIRIVGYDRRGRVAGVETPLSPLQPRIPTAALHGFRPIVRVAGPNGAVATLRAGRAVREFRCWRLDVTGAPPPRGCSVSNPTAPWTGVYLVQPADRDLFVVGQTGAPVVRVRLRFGDGSSISTRPTRGLFVLAIPRAHLSGERQLAYLLGLREDGSVHQRQGVLFKLPR